MIPSFGTAPNAGKRAVAFVTAFLLFPLSARLAPVARLHPRRAGGRFARRTGSFGDGDGAHLPLDGAAHEINVQQSVVEPSAGDLDALGQNEGALELPRGNAAMKVDSILIVGLLATDDELVVLDLDTQIVHGEAGHGQRDTKLILTELLDVVRRIAVRRRLADPVERPLEMIKTQKERGIEKRQPRHLTSSYVSEGCGRAPSGALLPWRSYSIAETYVGREGPMVKMVRPAARTGPAPPDGAHPAGRSAA